MKKIIVFIIYLISITIFQIPQAHAIVSEQDIEAVDKGAYFYQPGCTSNTSLTIGDTACRGVYYPKVADKAAFAAALTKYIKSEKPSSPMATDEMGRYLVDAGEKYNVNPMMLVAMAYQESSLCTDNGPCLPNLNPWGNLTNSAPRRLVKYNSWEESVFKWAEWVSTAHIGTAKKTTLELEIPYHCGVKDIYTVTSACDGPGYYKKTIERMNKMIQLAGPALACSGATSTPVLPASGCQCLSGNSPTAAVGPIELEGHKLPATKGGVGSEQAINSEGYVVNDKGEVTGGKVTFSNYANLGQEYRDYYITMRWRYAKWNWQGNSQPGPEDAGWYNQDEPRKVLVTNPRTGKSIIAAVLEAGPAPWTGISGSPSASDPLSNSQKALWSSGGEYRDGTPDGYLGRIAGLPPVAQKALDMKQWEWGGPSQTGGSGDELLFSWANDQTAKPGPVDSSGNPVATNTNGSVAVCDQSTYGVTIVPGNFVYYSQVDPRWASVPYSFKSGCGSKTIGSSGCGPTSVAMVISTFTGSAITPPKIVEQFGATYQMNECGTAWGMFGAAAKAYGLKSADLGRDKTRIINALKSGSLILAGGEGAAPYSKSGHIVVFKGIDASGNIIVANPGSLKGDNQVYSIEQVMAGLTGATAVSK